MAQNIAVGIDVGTYQVKVVISELPKGSARMTPSILGKGVSESRGLRHGYIMNQADAAKSIRSAIAQAEKIAGIKIRKAYLSIGGIGLGSVIAQGTAVASRADSEITELDTKKALEAAEAAIPESAIINRKVLHAIPLEYKLDGKKIHGRAIGMKGVKLEVRALFVMCTVQHLQDLIQSVEEAGIEVEDVMAAPLAASLVTLTKAQKIAGCVLANIGAETVSIAVFENNIPISLEVFPLGSNDITNDIALGLKISLEEAEMVKEGGLSRSPYSKKKLDEIVSARLYDCFESIEAHLKKLGRDKLLPAGIILSGGSSKIPGVKLLAEEALSLPAQIAEIHFGTTDKNKLKDNSWTVPCGLALLGFNSDGESSSSWKIGGQRGTSINAESGANAMRKVSKWFSQFLP
jgi:cell division protein FtsA